MADRGFAPPARSHPRRVQEGWMHDIGRTQLEQQQPLGESELELEGSEYEGSEFEGELGEFEGEFGEYEGGFGEYEGGFGEYEGELEGGTLEGSAISPELESPLTEMQEMEFAS